MPHGKAPERFANEKGTSDSTDVFDIESDEAIARREKTDALDLRVAIYAAMLTFDNVTSDSSNAVLRPSSPSVAAPTQPISSSFKLKLKWRNSQPFDPKAFLQELAENKLQMNVTTNTSGPTATRRTARSVHARVSFDKSKDAYIITIDNNKYQVLEEHEFGRREVKKRTKKEAKRSQSGKECFKIRIVEKGELTEIMGWVVERL